MIHPAVAKLAALPDEERRRVVRLAMASTCARLGLPVSGEGEPYSPGPSGIAPNPKYLESEAKI